MLEKEAQKVDPRVRRTRQMLQQAMEELMREKDFSEINVQDITERADLNRATFYKHFPDKYDLMNVISRERFQSLLDERLAEPCTLNAHNVDILIQTAFDSMNGIHGNCQAGRVSNERSVIMQHIQQQVYEVLVGWMEKVSVQAPLEGHSREMIALAISWMICGSLMQVVWETPRLPKQDMIRQLGVSVRAALGGYLNED